MYSHQFWSKYFIEVNVARLAILLDVLRERLLPCFDNIAEEAERKSQEAWESMAADCAPYEIGIEPDVAAELARDAGLDHYQALNAARQTLLNSFAVSMYHLWEQQVIGFMRREILHPRERNDAQLHTLHEFQQRLEAVGVNISHFQCWNQLQVFRKLANAVKHAEGPAAATLRQQRPEWFLPPSFRDDSMRDMMVPPSLYEPLGGEDLYIGIEDLEALVKRAAEFWTELVDALAAVSSRRSLGGSR